VRQDVTHPCDSVEPSPPTLESLFRTQRLAMVRLAHLIIGSNAVAEEIVQEAFIRMQNNWDRADNPTAYLRTIVTNLCKTQLRRRDREHRLDQPPPPASFQPDIDETWLAVCRLPFRQRAALALRFYEDLEEAEIARILGCRLGTVKSTIHRGLARLRKEMS
jgi:RNA polymerase sigma-70 factor (sigma-E family)